MDKQLQEYYDELDKRYPSPNEHLRGVSNPYFDYPHTPPSKKLWRTLIRFEEINSSYGFLTIPAWEPTKTIALPIHEIPDFIIRKIKIKNEINVYDPIFKEYRKIEDVRCHAFVNIGCEKKEDLTFAEWEID